MSAVSISDFWDLAVEDGIKPDRVEISKTRGGVQAAIRVGARGIYIGMGITCLEAVEKCLAEAGLATKKWEA